MRWMRTTPFAVRLTRWYQANVRPGWAPSEGDMQAAAELLTHAYNGALARAPREKLPFKWDYLSSAQFGNDQVAQALDVGTFHVHGRNVFLLPSDLVALLTHTDLSGVRLSDLKLPFQSFYIGWGDALPVSLPGPANQIDGVYCHFFEDRQLRLGVTARRLGVQSHDSTGWPWCHDLVYGAVFHPEGEDDLLDSLIDRAVANNDIPVRPEAPAAPAAARVETPDGEVQVTSREALTAEAVAEFARGGLDPFRLAVSVAMNALCYLTALPELGPKVYTSDAPAAHVKRATAAPAESRIAQKAEDRLIEGGYVPVRLVPFEAAREAVEGRDTGRETSPHWRRGHWRRQPFGEGRRLTRLQWIRPTLVRADRGAAVHGHVYRD